MNILVDEKVEEHLAKNLQQLLAHWPGDVPDITLVLNDGSAYHASAVPTGQIVLQLGVLKNVESFDELSFVLAHEAAHILKDHFRSVEKREELDSAMVLGLQLVATGDSLAHDGSASEVTQKAALATQLGAVANDLMGFGWDRGQEIEADGIAYELLLDAGLSGDGAMDSIDRLISEEDKVEKALEERCGGKPSIARDFLGGLTKSFSDAIAKKEAVPADPLCSGVKRTLASFTKSHPKASDRRKALEAHNDLHFSDRAVVLQQVFEEGGYLAQISPNGSISRTERARLVLAALERDDVSQAKSLVSGVLLDENDPLPWGRYARYHYRMRTGDRAGAIRDLEFSVADGGAFREIYKELAERYAQDGRFHDAIAHVDMAASRFGYPELHYVAKLRYLILAEDIPGAWTIYGQCTRQRALAEQCGQVADIHDLDTRYKAYKAEKEETELLKGEGGEVVSGSF